MIKKIIDCFKYYGLSAFKILKYVFIKKIHKVTNPKKTISTKGKKTGEKPFYIRPYTTDLKILMKMLLSNGEYDFIYEDKFLNIIKNSKYIIDAGANIGVFSRLVLEINNTAKIIAIEPETNNFEMLKKNLGDNSICLQKGIFNEKCNLIINDSPNGEWGFTVSKVADGKKYDVKAISINDIINDYNIEEIGMVKMDIEGSEFYVFDESSDKWLKKTKILIIEFHDRKIPGCSKKVLDKMKKLGFIYKIYSENYVFYKE